MHKPRRKANAKRDSGGVIVYVKHEISIGIKLLKAGPEDALWLLLDKEFFNLKENIVFCACYRIPDNSSHQPFIVSDMFDLLQENMVIYSEKYGCEFIICGDLNCRTATEDDFISDDHIEHMPLPDDYISDDNCQFKRVNEDSVVNSAGRKLLELCKSSNLRIVNGRMGNDAGIGRVTCIKYNGSSLVDYILCSETLLSCFTEFEVMSNVMFSDHCPISACISIEYHHKVNECKNRIK